MKLGQSTLSPAERVTEAKRHLTYLANYLEAMLPKERLFVEDMTNKLDGGFVSPNQLFWLRDLSAKY